MMLRLLASLVRCYPPAFRAEFEAEILDVLAARLREGGRRRIFQRLLVAAREFFGLLFSIPQLWLAARFTKEPLMTVENIPTPGYGTEPRDHQPGSLNEALLSGLPHILAALLISVENLSPQALMGLAPSAYTLIAGAVVMFYSGVLFFAYRKGWPLWSASWYLYVSWILLAFANFAVTNLIQGDSWRYLSLLLLAWVSVFIILYFRLYLKDPARALLSIAFTFPMLGTLLIEFVPDRIELSLAIGLGLACAGAAAAIVRSGSYQLAWRLIVVVNLAAGLLNAYVSEYQIRNFPFTGAVYTPSFTNFLTALAFQLAFTFSVLFLPMGIWKAGVRKPAS